MSLQTPTTGELTATFISQQQASIGQNIPLLPKAFLRVQAKVLAGIIVLLYKYGGSIFLQQYVQTASFEETVILGKKIRPLLFWGRLVNVSDPTAPVPAELNLTVTVVNQTGSIAAGTQLIGGINGVTYVAIAGVNLDAPTVQLRVRAVADQTGGQGAGVIGNLNTGDIVSFAGTIANVNRDAITIDQAVTGANEEDREVYRARVLKRFQKRPQGGAYADYQQWGEEAAGIINVYPYTGDPGQVNVYSEATPASSGSVDGVPTAAQLTAVFDIIEQDSNGLANRRNASAFVNSLAITRTGFTVSVTGIQQVANLPEVQADATAALVAYFLSVEPFIAGLDFPPRNDQITRTRVSGIIEDVVTAAAGVFVGVTFIQTGAPGTLVNYILGEGEKAKIDQVMYM